MGHGAHGRFEMAVGRVPATFIRGMAAGLCGRRHRGCRCSPVGAAKGARDVVGVDGGDDGGLWRESRRRRRCFEMVRTGSRLGLSVLRDGL